MNELGAQLDDAVAALKAHLASWEYAYAMAAGPDGEHPVHWRTRERTAQLETRVADLRARLAEHDA
jgi:uncharacterized protein YceH (UPF0502 family)